MRALMAQSWEEGTARQAANYNEKAPLPDLKNDQEHTKWDEANNWYPTINLKKKKKKKKKKNNHKK